jgi:hypothetical protein
MGWVTKKGEINCCLLLHDKVRICLLLIDKERAPQREANLNTNRGKQKMWSKTTKNVYFFSRFHLEETQFCV